MTEEQLEEKIFALFDGKLSDLETEQLYGVLENSFEARMVYYDAIGLQESLITRMRGIEYSSAHLLDEEIQKKVIPLESARQNHTATMAVAAMLVLSCVGILWWQLRPDEKAIAAVHLSQGAEVEFFGDVTEGQVVSLLGRSGFQLDSGIVELTFDNGVRGVIEAPATMTIENNLSVVLDQGKAWFDVPEEGHGFMVRSQDALIKDLGTQFGVVARYGASDEIYVYDGLVESAPVIASNRKQVLKEGQALAINEQGNTEAIDFDAQQFYTEMHDPLEYLHWSFDEVDGGEFVVSGNLRTELPMVTQYIERGTPKTPPLVEGVFGSAAQLDKGAFLRSNWHGMGGSQSMTVAMWSKSSGFGEVSYLRLLHWGLDDRSQEAGFKLFVNQRSKADKKATLGALRFSVGTTFAVGNTLINDERWHHIVAVYDAQDGGSISLYVDGELESISAYNEKTGYVNVKAAGSRPLTIGSAKFLSSVDELYLIRGTIDAKQVKRLFEKNLLH